MFSFGVTKPVNQFAFFPGRAHISKDVGGCQQENTPQIQTNKYVWMRLSLYRYISYKLLTLFLDVFEKGSSLTIIVFKDTEDQIDVICLPYLISEGL